MLKHLLIKNYALIEELEIFPANDLNVITGETGAGKSIMLGAVGLLLGNRAETKVLLNEEEKCTVEGEFKITEYNLQPFFQEEDLEYDVNTIIRREINPLGKSRAFINDSPVTLDVLTRLGQKLMDVHSQHENLELGKGLYQLNLIDIYAGNKLLLEQYQQDYREFIKNEKAYQHLISTADKLKQEADYNRFLLQELEEAALADVNQEELENELSTLENAEEIKSSLFQASNILSEGEFAGLNSINEARAQLQQAVKFSEKYRELYDRLESAYLELEDASKEIQQQQELVEFDPAQAELIKSQLSKIYQLQKKHGVLSVGELQKIEEDLAQKVSTTDSLDEETDKIKAAMDDARIQMDQSAEELSHSRKAVFEELSKNLQKLLSQLGMPNARIVIEHEDESPTLHGKDKVNILFSANKGISPQAIHKIASGGEFSRLIFCIKYILAQKTALPTVVFDEIDTGVSGEIALKLAEMMKEMSSNHQIVVISHSPQVAARANTQYFVFKDDEGLTTTSRIKELTKEERIYEIARMIGGDNPAPVAIENAKNLMKVS
ncbi:MAG: DNA repair protein RecN [Candidatus Cyclobacteriaceae bacterium M2_1C_046]